MVFLRSMPYCSEKVCIVLFEYYFSNNTLIPKFLRGTELIQFFWIEEILLIRNFLKNIIFGLMIISLSVNKLYWEIEIKFGQMKILFCKMMSCGGSAHRPTINDEYDIISCVGCGGYSSVFKAMERCTGHIVALKKVNKFNIHIGLPISYYREKKCLK